jgi:CRP-like cAMP-binding protein
MPLNQNARISVAQNHLNATVASQASNNLILRAIPQSEYQRILPSLELITMEWHSSLHDANEPIEFGYFPSGGVVSFIVPMNDGRSAEVGLVGREGFVGVPLAGGLNRSPHLALVQVAATAMRIRAWPLQKLLPSTPCLAMLLTRYALVHGMQLAQTAACNRLHNLEERLARWLLMSQDRVKSNVLPYTQDLLATMLGTDRPSVSIASGELQKKGSIKQKRGRVEIIDRSRLKMSACECYRVIREFNRELDLEPA